MTPDAWIAFATVGGTLVGLFVGDTIGKSRGFVEGVRAEAARLSIMNDLRKASSRIGTVADFIPPGADAEIVERDEDFWGSSANDQLEDQQHGCAGCRYAGRYVLKPRGTIEGGSYDQ